MTLSPPPGQEITSANTCLAQVPALFAKNWFQEFLEEGSGLLLDYGCGRTTRSGQIVEHYDGWRYHGYDPYNAPDAVNQRARTVLHGGRYFDIVTCCNVLNVLARVTDIHHVVAEVAEALEPGGVAVFQIYEGNRNGCGRITKNGYQRHEKAEDYLRYFEPYFLHTERVSNFIIARRPAKLN